MPKVLAILEYGDRLASGIVRGLVYRDLFTAHGFAVEFVTRMPLQTMDWLAAPHRFYGRFLKRERVRARILEKASNAIHQKIFRKARDCDIVYCSKVLDYRFVRQLRESTDARIVFDFGDAIWLYDEDRNDFHTTLSLVDAVTTDNELTAAYIRQFNSNCTVIPDCPQIEQFDARRDALRNKPDDRFVIGWVGSPGTCYNLYAIWEPLEALFAKFPYLHLRLVGGPLDRQLLPPFEQVRYSVRPNYDQAGMIEEVFGMHVGLFPLQDVEKCRVRGVLKATVYMSGEAAVIGSPVGQSSAFIRDGYNGLLAATSDEWLNKLTRLVLDDGLRQKLVHGGLETVRSEFRLESSFLKLKEVFLGLNNVQEQTVSVA